MWLYARTTEGAATCGRKNGFGTLRARHASFREHALLASQREVVRPPALQSAANEVAHPEPVRSRDGTGSQAADKQNQGMIKHPEIEPARAALRSLDRGA